MNKQKLLDLIGPAFLCHEINCKPIEQIISDLADDIMLAYEQPDISEDVGHSGFMAVMEGQKKTNEILKSIPTVDEDIRILKQIRNRFRRKRCSNL